MRDITKHTAIAIVILIALAALVLPAAARTGMKTIQNGDTVYAGEEDLDFATYFPEATYLIHYSDYSGNISDNLIDISGSPGAFDILAADVGSVTGPYYFADATDRLAGNPWVDIEVPSVTLDILINGSTNSIAGKTATRDSEIDFKITNNLGGLYAAAPTMQIDITTPGGGKLNIFNGVDMRAVPINNAQVKVLDVPLAGIETGTYSAQAKWDSTSPTGFYNKGYNSNTVSFDVTTRSLGIVSNKDSVVRGNNFVVTITGESSHRYFVYIKTIGSTAAGEFPWIPTGQPGVTIGANPPKAVNNATAASQANITTTLSGNRPVQFNTNYSTKDETYIIEVIDIGDTSKSDTVRVKVELGVVTICAAGTGTYYIGEEITLSGTNTANTTTWLYLVGQNLGNGNGVKLDDIRVCADNLTLPANQRMVAVPVDTDDTWEYRWDTRNLGAVPDSGTYTIYAVAAPHAKNALIGTRYSTASVALRSPYITATVSSASIAKGSRQIISGYATGNPDYVYVWIFGKNYRFLSESVIVETDGSFEYTLATTGDYSSGTCYVIVQHTMMDGIQSPSRIVGTNSILLADGSIIDLSNLQAAAAATALTDAMAPWYIDDEYSEITFMIDEPWIVINPIPDQMVNTIFTISGTTDLAAGDILLVTVTSSSFQPGVSPVDQFTGASGSITVVSSTPYNTWSFEVDATDFSPDKYEVWVESISTGEFQCSYFNITPASSDPGSGITLFPGWNFISTPKRLSAGNNTAAIFQHVDTAGHSIFAYDAGLGAWRNMAATDEVRPLDGIWIYANSTASVQLDYDSGAAQTPPVKSLSQGWNAIGFSGLEQASARDALYAVRAGWANVIGWDAEGQQYETAIVNGGSGAFNDTRLMQPGQGYWLYMTDGGNLSGLSP